MYVFLRVLGDFYSKILKIVVKEMQVKLGNIFDPLSWLDFSKWVTANANETTWRKFL